MTSFYTTITSNYEKCSKEERLYSTEPWLTNDRNTPEETLEQKREDEQAVRHLIGDPADIDLHEISRNDKKDERPSFSNKDEFSDFVNKIYEEQRRQCELGIPYSSTEDLVTKKRGVKGYQCKKGERKDGKPRKKRELVARAHVSYFVVSGLALLNAKEPIMSRDIYRFAKYYFPGCVTSSHWKNSIRHILSTQEFFIKMDNQEGNTTSATWTWSRAHLGRLEAAIEDLENTLKGPEFFGMADPSQWPAIRDGTAGHPDKDFPIDIEEKGRRSESSSPTPSLPSDVDPASPRFEESQTVPVVRKGKRKATTPAPQMKPTKKREPQITSQQLTQYHFYQQQQQQYMQYLHAYYRYQSQQAQQSSYDLFSGNIFPANQKPFFDGDIDEMVQKYLIHPFTQSKSEQQVPLAQEKRQNSEVMNWTDGKEAERLVYETLRVKSEPRFYEEIGRNAGYA